MIDEFQAIGGKQKGFKIMNLFFQPLLYSINLTTLNQITFGSEKTAVDCLLCCYRDSVLFGVNVTPASSLYKELIPRVIFPSNGKITLLIARKTG